MKIKILIIAIGIGISFMISGCGQNSTAEAVSQTADSVEPEKQNQNTGEQQSPEVENNTVSDEAYEDSEEDIDGDTFVPINEEEMRAVTDFVRRIDAYGFLLSEYGSPEDVSLGPVFYMGAGLQENPTAEEVKAYLLARDQDEINTTCMKLDRDKVFDLLERRLDCDIAELDLSNIGEYLPEYKAYLYEEADVNYVEYSCVSGIKNAADGYEVMLHTDDMCEEGFSDLRTVLLKKGDEFYFISNECQEKDNASIEKAAITENSIDEKYVDEHAEEIWEILYKEKFSSSSPIEMRHGLGSMFSVVLYNGNGSFDENGKEMFYEGIVSLEDYDDGNYHFWWHEDYYDGDELFGTKTRDWYWVNEKEQTVN